MNVASSQPESSAPPEAARQIQPAEEAVLGGFARIELVEPTVDEVELARDRDRLLQCQLEGFGGVATRKLERDLVGYAARVLPSLIRRGQIFPMMHKRGVVPARDDALPKMSLSEGDCIDLAQDTVAAAWPKFLRTLVDGGWDPWRDDPTTLKSFFVGRCALEFRGPWRRFLRARPQELRECSHQGLEVLERQPDETSNPERLAGIIDLRRRIFQLVPNAGDREVLRLDVEGWSDQEIADVTGLTTRAVESRLRRIRTATTSLLRVQPDVPA